MSSDANKTDLPANSVLQWFNRLVTYLSMLSKNKKIVKGWVCAKETDCLQPTCMASDPSQAIYEVKRMSKLYIV